MKHKQPIEAILEVNAFASTGEGIAPYHPPEKSASLVSIPYAIPGDTVKANLFKKRAGIYSSRLEEVIKPSPHRITPRCRHFGTCGGCSWQQISCEAQLQQKQARVGNYFADLLHETIDVRPIIPSHSSWRYRNKMEFTFSRTSSGDSLLGLYKAKSHGRIVDLSECHLAPEWFTEALAITKQWWSSTLLLPYHARTNTGSLRTLTLREGFRSGDRMAILTVSGHPDFQIEEEATRQFTDQMIKALTPTTGHLTLYLCKQFTAKGTPTHFAYSLLHGPETLREELFLTPSQKLTFQISPQAFFQPNPLQAEILYRTALQLAEISPESIVYDLYCGTGTLGMFASHQAKEVIGMELNPQSVENALRNIENNQLTNIRILQGDVGKLITDHPELPTPDLVMVDPPRCGLDSTVIEHLQTLHPDKILYISCNPASQSQNAKDLVKIGYRLTTLQPVDQFPHTPHIENIALFKKS